MKEDSEKIICLKRAWLPFFSTEFWWNIDFLILTDDDTMQHYKEWNYKIQSLLV